MANLRETQEGNEDINIGSKSNAKKDSGTRNESDATPEKIN